MNGRRQLRELAAEEPELQAWFKQHGNELLKALGVYFSGDSIEVDNLILALTKIPEYFGGRWKGYKDDIDRARCDVLSPFLRGEAVDRKELRIAVSLLVQKNGCERTSQIP